MNELETYGKKIGAADAPLTTTDLIELSAGAARVQVLMSDGAWHSADAIRLAAGTNGNPASEGLRRLRELREMGTVEKARIAGTRLWDYRLVTA